MIPGSVSKVTEATMASAATITAKTDVVVLTGTTTINTIIPGLGTAVSQMVTLLPVSGAVTLGTSGNIAVGIAMAQNRIVTMIYVRSQAKWFIESGV